MAEYNVAIGIPTMQNQVARSTINKEETTVAQYDFNECLLDYLEPRLGAAALARTAGNGRSRLMVFVHGGHGDYIGTWTNSDTKTYWPDLVRNDVANFGSMDVARFDYASPKWFPAKGVEDTAKVLLQLLRDSKAADYDDIVFVAHSLGGVVTRHFLVDLDRLADPLLGKIRLVMSMTCAYGGSDVPKMLFNAGSQNKQFEDVTPGSSFLTGLNGRWETLQQKLNPQQRSRPFVWSVWGESDKVITCEHAKLGCDEILRIKTPDGSIIVRRGHEELGCRALSARRTSKEEVLFPRRVRLNHPGPGNVLVHSNLVKPEGTSHVSHLALREAFRLAVSDSNLGA